MAASNTKECFDEFIGLRVKGVLFNALPQARKDLAAGTTTLVFEDGRGLTFKANDSGFMVWWIESQEDIARAIDAERDALRSAQRRTRELLSMAGVGRKSAREAD